MRGSAPRPGRGMIPRCTRIRKLTLFANGYARYASTLFGRSLHPHF